MLDGGRPAREDVCVALEDRVGVLTLQPVHQRRVPVHVVEVFEQPEPIDLRQVRIRLALRDRCRYLDRDLLESDGRLQRRLVGRVQPVDQRLLVLLHPAHESERTLKLLVHARAGVAEAERLALDAVHEDHSNPRERIRIELAVCRTGEIPPGESLAVERHALLLHDVESHVDPPFKCLMQRTLVVVNRFVASLSTVGR